MSDEEPHPHNSSKLSVFIALGLFIFVVVSRFLATLAYPIEVGIDGAYYTINVTSLLTEGSLYYDAPILSFAVAALFALALGGNVIVGVKLTSAFFAAILTVGMFYAGFTLSEGDYRAGLIAGLLTAFDVFMFHAATSLVKNEAALAFLPFAVAFLYRFIAKGYHASDLAVFLIMGTLTVLSHLMTVAWLFAAIIAFIGYETAKQLQQKQGLASIRKFVLPIALSGFFFLGLYLSFDILIPSSETWYTSSSLLKAAYYSTSVDTMGALLNFLGIAQAASPTTVTLFDWFYTTYVTTILILTILGAIYLFKRNSIGGRLVLVLLITNILIGFVMGSWLIRFIMMNFIPLYLILGLSLIPLMDKIASGLNYTLRTFGFQRRSRTRHVLSVLTILFLAGLAIPNFYYVATAEIQPYVTLEDLQSIQTLEGQFPEESLLYAPEGVNYFITSRIGYESPPVWNDKNWPVYCAQKMYFNQRIKGRQSYYVIKTNQSPFIQYSLGNRHARIQGIGNFDLIKNNMNLTIITEHPTNHIYCSVRHIDHTKIDLTHSVTPTREKRWDASLSLGGLPDGLYVVHIAPQPISDSNPDPQRCWFTFYIYHFNSLPEPRVPIQHLVFEAAGNGNIHVMAVNETTATRINILHLRIAHTSRSNQPVNPEPFMVSITPFFFIPYQQLVWSNFILILLLCPLNTIYLLALIRILGRITKYASLQLHRLYLALGSPEIPTSTQPKPAELPLRQTL